MPGPGGKQVECCGAEWAAIYANRVRQMMNTYRQDGAARVYWLTLPTPRDAARQQIIDASSTPRSRSPPSRGRSRSGSIDTVPIFTPGGSYRDAMDVDGKQTIVREPDGIHLNDDRLVARRRRSSSTASTKTSRTEPGRRATCSRRRSA